MIENTKKNWIIGDIHGCFDTLMLLLKQLPPEANNTNIIFLGDLIDRGPKSFEVVEFIKDGNYKCVIGNHEQMLLQGIEEANLGIYHDMYSCWQQNGGDKCAKSYNDNPSFLKPHTEWMSKLPLYITEEYENNKDLLITHAPSIDFFERILKYKKELMKPWNEISQESRDSMNLEINSLYNIVTWNRQPPKTESEKYFGVSGHNVWNKMPFADPENKCVINRRFASIDTGVCFPEESYGILTALEYPTMKLYQQELVDEIEIDPPKAARTHAW